MSTVTLGGNPVNVAGNFPKAGDNAPEFALTGKDLKDVGLKDFAGKRKVLNIVPSLDTPVCQTSTRKFNEKAGSLANTVVLVTYNHPNRELADYLREEDGPWTVHLVGDVNGTNGILQAVHSASAAARAI